MTTLPCQQRFLFPRDHHQQHSSRKEEYHTMSGALPPALEALTARLSIASSPSSLPPLKPTRTFDSSLTSQIDTFVQSDYNSKPCIRATLHLINDDIKTAHKICQDSEGEITSDLCHAILHRREGDYWNSREWYKLIHHPLIEEIHGGNTQASEFVDAVEALVTGKGGASTPCAAGNVDKLKQRQAKELSALLRFAIENK